MERLTLVELVTPLAVCRLDPEAPLPAWALNPGPLVSLTRTAEELSLVCPQDQVPATVRAERDFRAFKVAGQLDFALTGVLAGLLAPLAEAGVSVFALSTFDTDYLLVREDRLSEARRALGAVCRLAGPPPDRG